MKKYKIKKTFGSYLNFTLGEIREFTDTEALRFAHLIEPVTSDSVNSLDVKPDKQLKRGRRKIQ